MMTDSHLEEITSQAECLYTLKDIDAALDVLAQKIEQRLSKDHPIILPVMTGGVMFAADLMRRCHFPMQLDYLHATRYQNNLSGGHIHWLAEPKLPLEGRTILIADDVLDGGITLAEIVAYCKKHGAREVYTTVMVDKADARVPTGHPKADFTALTCDNRYLFGYGMDYKGYLRNAPGIYAVNESKTDE